jgi:hypothetical protein
VNANRLPGSEGTGAGVGVGLGTVLGVLGRLGEGGVITDDADGAGAGLELSVEGAADVAGAPAGVAMGDAVTGAAVTEGGTEESAPPPPQLIKPEITTQTAAKPTVAWAAHCLDLSAASFFEI